VCIYLIIIVVVVDVAVIESRLRTLPPPQSRKSDYAHFLYRRRGKSRSSARAVYSRLLAPLSPRLSNLVTLMPEIDDISPDRATRSPAALMTSS